MVSGVVVAVFAAFLGRVVFLAAAFSGTTSLKGSSGEISAFRERICAAAFELFATQGYAAVTMRAIATKIGCSPMTPYRYFVNKSEIFALVSAEAFRRFEAPRGARSHQGPATGLP